MILLFFLEFLHKDDFPFFLVLFSNSISPALLWNGARIILEIGGTQVAVEIERRRDQVAFRED